MCNDTRIAYSVNTCSSIMMVIAVIDTSLSQQSQIRNHSPRYLFLYPISQIKPDIKLRLYQNFHLHNNPQNTWCGKCSFKIIKHSTMLYTYYSSMLFLIIIFWMFVWRYYWFFTKKKHCCYICSCYYWLWFMLRILLFWAMEMY